MLGSRYVWHDKGLLEDMLWSHNDWHDKGFPVFCVGGCV